MYLGIDLGTSALKVILIDDDQNLLGEKNIPLEVNRPQTLFSEQTFQKPIQLRQAVVFCDPFTSTRNRF